MAEFFLELFSEEIPSRLQINARNDLIQIFKKFFDDNEIKIKGKINIYSTPNRLIVHINKISKDVTKKAEEIRGPNINHNCPISLTFSMKFLKANLQYFLLINRMFLFFVMVSCRSRICLYLCFF